MAEFFAKWDDVIQEHHLRYQAKLIGDENVNSASGTACSSQPSSAAAEKEEKYGTIRCY